MRVRAAVLALVVVVAVTAFTSGAPSAADGNEAPGAPPAARTLSAGASHTCAVVTGQVRCWGFNDDGQLGVGDTANRSDQPDETGARLPAVDLGVGRTATAVSAGEGHTCAVLDDGTVKCWGDNAAGRLGLGDLADRGDGPGEMGDALPAVDLGTGRTATSISAGLEHTCAVLDNGAVKCWGEGGFGRLGIGSSGDRGDGPGELGDSQPTVDLGTGRTAVAVVAGGLHTCALLDNGTVKCWGAGAAGRLGLGDTTNRGDAPGEMGDALPAVDLGTGRSATAVTAGRNHTCALLDIGTVKCWGAGEYGQLGLGSTLSRGSVPGEMGDALPEVDLGAGRVAVAVTAGSHHTCALLDTAAVKCWGANGSGQLGLGNVIGRGDSGGEMGDALPTVDLGVGAAAAMVTAGGTQGSTRGHSCAALTDGTVRCWGESGAGQLGIGATADRGDGPGEMGNALPGVTASATGVVGDVRSADGTALTGALVALLDPTDFRLRGGGVADEPDGRYAAPAAVGAHLVYAVDPTGAHRPGFFGAPTAVTVPPGGIGVSRGTLEPALGTVTGTVTDATSGAPVDHGYVVLIDLATGEPERGVSADPEGDYVFTGLPAGSYLVAFLDLEGGHVPRLFGASGSGLPTPVVVAPGTSAIADGALPAQAPLGGSAGITGQVVEPGGGAVAGSLVLALRASDLSFARAALADATGGYSLAVPPGDYLLAFVDPSGAHRAQWHGGQPSGGLPDATPVTAPSQVNPVLERIVGSFSGQVTGADGAPIADAWVLALRPSGIVGGAISAADGSYAIVGLPPDNYRAAVVSPDDGVLEYWPDSPTYAGADLFAVVAGQDSPVDALLEVT